MEKIYFKNSKGNNMCGIISNPCTENNKLVILCHGFTSSKEGSTNKSLESMFNRNNIATLRFDFYGHGESDGDFSDITVSEAVDDILNAIKYVKSIGYSNLALVGSSFGGISSILAAAKTTELSALALKSPVSNYYEAISLRMSEVEIKEWEKKGIIENKIGKGGLLKYTFYSDFENFNAYESAKRIKVPTLIVHGSSDDIVPATQSERLVKEIPDCRLEIIERADHRYSKKEDFDKVIYLITEFIMKNI